MMWKWIGAVLVIVGCGGFGFLIAAGVKREERYLRELLEAMEFMTSELKYRMTSLPELINHAANHTSGTLFQVFSALDRELATQIAPNAESCLRTALKKTEGVPVLTGRVLRMLGRSLGKFDLAGQISGINFVKDACRENLQLLARDKTERLRSYRTLGICAGIALAILLL
jgi:stage III sporulation protein AB